MRHNEEKNAIIKKLDCRTGSTMKNKTWSENKIVRGRTNEKKALDVFDHHQD